MRARRAAPGRDLQALPIDIVRGEGMRLFAADGRSYLDFTSGIGVNALGYADAGIAEAMVARSFASSVFFCNSGAEPNDAA
ncbi:MAG: aminotransferase class III-fold pyridoxal phosphate-dependent enzyme [Gemmatimonadaceae bacterium]